MKENEMIHTGRVLIVEGKYDAARLSHLTDAMILLTDGFGIYSDKKRQQLFKALAQKNGLILLTDSDAAGFRIRTYITNLVGEKNVVQAYVPAIHGKEKRKAQPGKEGLLGVEGVDDALVRQALLDALGAEAGAAPVRPVGRQITYTDLSGWGLSGKPGSAERKARLLNALGLPPRCMWPGMHTRVSMPVFFCTACAMRLVAVVPKPASARFAIHSLRFMPASSQLMAPSATAMMEKLEPFFARRSTAEHTRSIS